MSIGLYPQPPNLSLSHAQHSHAHAEDKQENAHEDSHEESHAAHPHEGAGKNNVVSADKKKELQGQFWIIKHGIRASAV